MGTMEVAVSDDETELLAGKNRREGIVPDVRRTEGEGRLRAVLALRMNISRHNRLFRRGIDGHDGSELVRRRPLKEMQRAITRSRERYQARIGPCPCRCLRCRDGRDAGAQGVPA